jgi:competence protein ComEC
MRARRSLLPTAIGVAVLLAFALAHTGQIRDRASVGLGRGMPPREAALARGFVLGQDEEVDPVAVEDFRRAGLSHLLAVSGENVTLLALLAMPVLAALGLGLRERLLWVLGLIALYVPLAGAGPSIQRAGVMGAVGVLAMLRGRRASRLYAIVVALIVTLAIDPRAAADAGWQLSFAAVGGILALAAPLRRAISARIGSRGWRLAFAEGAAVTISAGLATAPLIAYLFEEVSTVTLFANLLALPAVAPAMWLGMLCAALAQAPGLGFAVAAVNALEAPLLAYIAQVAAWCGRPSWAALHVRMNGLGLAAAYLAMGAAIVAAMRLARRRRIAALRRRATPPPRRGKLRIVAPALLAVALVWGTASALGHGGGAAAPPAAGLRIEVLDVGQGDAILLQPAHAPALLVDGGPPGDGLAAKLRAAGVERLGAALITHDQSDHAGGIEELLGRFPIHRLLYAMLRRRTLAAIHAAGVVTERIAEGDDVRSGRLRLEALWPPRALLAQPLDGEDPNLRAVVALARWRRFTMLLTADAEAESVPVDPGPIDVLKVAHHGSDDTGLGALLDRTSPRLAVISVGEHNPYGHPTPGTLATLAAHRVPTLRTDRGGAVVIEVHGNSVQVSRGG